MTYSLKKLPKVELHCHFEASARLSTLFAEIKRHNLNFELNSIDQCKKLFSIDSPQKDLKETLDALKKIQSVYVAPDILERLAFEAIEDAYHNGVKLIEFRFAPDFLTDGHDYSFDDAVFAINRGKEKAQKKYEVAVGFIGIFVKDLPTKRHENTLKHFCKNANFYCGLDLAGTEKDYPPKNFQKYFLEAQNYGFQFTAHAGEEPGTSHNVMEAIETLPISRIGHGIQIISDARAIDLVKEKRIHLEVCPTSNYITNAIASLKEHPIKRLWENKISISINSDDPTLFNTNITKEYEICRDLFGFTNQQLLAISKSATQHSFIDEDQKKYVIKKNFDT